MLTADVEKRVDYWLNGPFDAETKLQVLRLKEKDPKGLVDAFFTDLYFGTGGLRGLMGPGTTRLNIYTIRLATQGLSDYLLQNKPEASVLIGFDSRHHSKEFAQEAAKVLAGNGIHVYLLEELRPTPFISFACRFKQADAAIMITASHNPKEYNGYKVYWSDGAQVVSPHDVAIMKAIEAITDLSHVKLSELNDPKIELTPLADLDAEYLKAIAPLQHFAKETKTQGSTLSIVYTSLHGTGITIIPKALQAWGFTNLHLVSTQVTIDGDFPTVAFPNPEYPQVYELGLKRLTETESDILLVTDPDADRIGTAVLHEGQPILINGNEMAALCVDYLCDILPSLDKMPKNGAFVTTIVTTELLRTIAQAQMEACFEVLTGFKYIGEKIREWEESKEYQFLFGAEESYGYLLGTHARDKDAIILSCLIAEMALYAKMRGHTLIDRLHKIYQTYGIFREKQLSIPFSPGEEGMQKMQQIIHSLRHSLHHSIPSLPLLAIEDYQTGERTIIATQQKQKLDLPQSDVLVLRMTDQSKLIIRPSGTEPKIKIYASASTTSFCTIGDGIKECDERIEKYLEDLKKTFQCSP